MPYAYAEAYSNTTTSFYAATRRSTRRNRRIRKSVLESDACRSHFTVALPLNQTAVVTATGKGVIRCRALFLKQRAGASRTRIHKDRTAGIEPRCDFLTVLPLLNLVNAIAAWAALSHALSLAQRAVTAIAASGVFCGLQVTDFDSLLRFFLCHSILLSNLVLAFRELSS